MSLVIPACRSLFAFALALAEVPTDPNCLARSPIELVIDLAVCVGAGAGLEVGVTAGLETDFDFGAKLLFAHPNKATFCLAVPL